MYNVIIFILKYNNLYNLYTIYKINSNIYMMNVLKNIKSKIILLVTLDTKMSEADNLLKKISNLNVKSNVIDISLRKSRLDKISLMESVSKKAGDFLKIIQSEGPIIVVVLAGGTGMQIALNAMSVLKPLTPRYLIGAFAEDVRPWIASSNTTVIPTIVDVNSNGPILDLILHRAAKQIVSNVDDQLTLNINEKSIGVTGLGVTEKAVKNLTDLIHKNNQKTSVFHSNGFGGAGLEMAIAEKWLSGLIDLTTHEATRIWIKGAHMPMPMRFSEQKLSYLPRVTIPGGLNFLSLGRFSSLSKSYQKRQFFKHSEAVTHVCLTENEMIKVANKLIEKLNRLSSPSVLAIPMGGFSSQDKTGGAIENIKIRELFRKVVSQKANGLIKVVVYKDHISSKSFAKTIYENFKKIMINHGENDGSK